MNDYDRLESESERPTKIVDHSARWARLEPVANTNGTVRERIERFCETKRINVDSLAALGARVKVDGNGGVELAFAYPANGIIPALKYRPLGDKARYSETPSTFLEPLVVGRRDSLDWFVAEGETDGCRLLELVGDTAAIVVLPAGAKTFKREWAARIPRGATVYLCHDADDAGDEGAAKAAQMIGGRTIRVRPPDGYKDFCEWDGDRDAFVELVRAARAQQKLGYEFASAAEFLVHEYPPAQPLLGDERGVLLAVGSLLLVYGAEGSSKSTWTVDGVAHRRPGSCGSASRCRDRCGFA
jgi:hypothetical protein